MIRKYHNHKPQTTLWHREEEPLNHHETSGRQIKQSNQLSLPHQDDSEVHNKVMPTSSLAGVLYFYIGPLCLHTATKSHSTGLGLISVDHFLHSPQL